MQWLDMNKGDGIKCKGLLAVAAINKSNEAMIMARPSDKVLYDIRM